MYKLSKLFKHVKYNEFENNLFYTIFYNSLNINLFV